MAFCKYRKEIIIIMITFSLCKQLHIIIIFSISQMGNQQMVIHIPIQFHRNPKQRDQPLRGDGNLPQTAPTNGRELKLIPQRDQPRARRKADGNPPKTAPTIGAWSTWCLQQP